MSTGDVGPSASRRRSRPSRTRSRANANSNWSSHPDPTIVASSWLICSSISASVGRRVRHPPGGERQDLGALGQRGAVVEQLLAEPEHPAAQRVERVVDQVDREAAAPQDPGDRLVVPHDRGRGLGPALEHLRRPAVPQHRGAGRHDPGPQRGLPRGRPSSLAVGSISLTIRSIMPSRRSSLLATWLYSDIGSTPSSWPSRRMLTASMPCSSASSTAARSTRSRLSG